MPVVGSGHYTYEVESWGKLPSGWAYGLVTGIAVDSEDRVYVCQQQQDPPVIVFDQNGDYLDSWGNGIIVEPHTIFIDSDDIIFLADRGAHVALKLTPAGEVLLELGNRGQPSDTGATEDEGEVLRAAGPFNRPTHMSPSPSGELYISDGYRNSRVHRFSAQGDLIASWGEPGESGPGEIRSPHSLWVDQDGAIYVCDRLNNRIQIFSAEGQFVNQWTDVQRPTDLHICQDGVVYVAERLDNDAAENWISVQDKSGGVIARWGIDRTHQIWVDRHGDIFSVTGAGDTVSHGPIVKYSRIT